MTYRPPAVLAGAILFLASCSSLGGDDVSGDSAATPGETADNAASGETAVADLVVASDLPAGRAWCGPVELTTEDIALGSARLTDAAVGAFLTTDVTLSAPEQWALIDQQPTRVVIADPVPLVDPGQDGGVASFWVRVLVPGIGLIHDDACRFAAPLDQTAPSGEVPGATEPSVCVAEPLAEAAVITWNREPGVNVVLRDGEDVLTVVNGDYPESITASLAERREVHGELTDPAQIVGVVVGAPEGEEHSYDLTTPDVSWTASCGAATAAGAGSLPETTSGSQAESTGEGEGEVAAGDQSLLQKAAAEGPLIPDAPYVYATLTPICDDCTADTIELYLSPKADNPDEREVTMWWRNGEPQPLDELGPWGVDPVTVADVLVARDAEEWHIDPGTLIVLSWAIDGQGAVLNCLELDLSPIELRDERCGPANLLGP